ncbi:REP-associated tyrosine transposase [Pseudoalteromonas sp. P1-7a]|uniref:REP-associated tyrosine transposase n=1 Tax=Pseudoalteromonas sp. P1-7a TaxID=1723755 RepID=UPI002286998A|nr:transposase [Pseudoalteromonas sp. P1-7a]
MFKSNSHNTICFVIMPDHIRWLFQLNRSSELSNLVRKFKNITTYRFNKHNGTNGKIWQTNYYDHKIRGDEDLIAQARYIVANPLRAKLVDNIDKYPY